MISCHQSSPFPCVYRGERFNGLLLEWPADCTKCKDRQCESTNTTVLSMCSYGFNYQRINDELTIAGILANNYRENSTARNKKYRKYKDWIINTSHIVSAVDSMREVSREYGREVDASKKAIIDDYIETHQYEKDFLDALKYDIQKGLSFVHDYKQINAQIAQNINVIIETKYKEGTLEEKLHSATHAELAIYWASKFLEVKLDAAKFLIHPEWITKDSECYPFRFHGLFLKYLRIYQYMFNDKRIRVSVSGESYKLIDGNAEAIGVIPHTFLDNALKYSRQNSRVDIFISDVEEGIELLVSSYGPRIRSVEKSKIFQPFFRAEEAKRIQEEGAGYGLYVAQSIAKALGTEIKVEQDGRLKEGLGHWTTFSVLLPSRS